MAIMASEAPRRRYISFLGLAYAALLLAASAAPASAQLLNDANDAADFSDFTSRAVPRAVGFVQAATCGSSTSGAAARRRR